VEVALARGQSLMAFAVTEFAVAMEWCVKWRAIQHRLQHVTLVQCFWTWLVGIRNTHAFDKLCDGRMIFGQASRRLVWWLLVWRTEYQKSKVRAIWRHTLCRIVQKRCLRVCAKAAEAWMACKQMVMEVLEVEAEQMYEKQKQEGVTATWEDWEDHFHSAVQQAVARCGSARCIVMFGDSEEYWCETWVAKFADNPYEHLQPVEFD